MAIPMPPRLAELIKELERRTDHPDGDER